MTDNTLAESLKNIQEGDTIECNLHGAGCVTPADNAVIKKINKNLGIFWTDNSDGGYVADSLYAFSISTGITVNNMIPGFFMKVSKVVPKKKTKK